MVTELSDNIIKWIKEHRNDDTDDMHLCNVEQKNCWKNNERDGISKTI